MAIAFRELEKNQISIQFTGTWSTSCLLVNRTLPNKKFKRFKWIYICSVQKFCNFLINFDSSNSRPIHFTPLAEQNFIGFNVLTYFNSVLFFDDMTSKGWKVLSDLTANSRKLILWNIAFMKKVCKKPLHYWLRPIKRGQFRFANFAPHLKGKCHFHFLIYWVLL